MVLSRFAIAFVSLCSFFVASPTMWAQDPPADKPAKQTDAKDDNAKDEDAKDSPTNGDEFYEVPESDSAELRDFIVKMLSFKPKTRSEAITHQAKAIGAVRVAAERMLKAEKDAKSVNHMMAESVLLQIDMQDLRMNPKADPNGVIDRTLAFVKKVGKDSTGMEVELLMLLGQTLEQSLDRPKLAAKVYSEGGEMLSKSSEERIRDFSERMLGMGRRVGLPGKKIELTGDKHNGDPFDIKSLKGKVVLVDFWATWCGPCIAEIPNMRANYERFGKHGFEIVGVSIDENRDALDGFLEKRELPWIILHEEGDEGHPAANYYGVSAIPTMFLVDRDGVVISTRANGRALTRLLEEQFPEVVAAEAEARAKENADLDPADK